MIKLRKRTRRLLLAMVLALLVAWLVALWAIPAAYAERGYRGIGGEWLLIASVGGAIYLTLAPQAKVRRGGALGSYPIEWDAATKCLYLRLSGHMPLKSKKEESHAQDT